MNDARAERTEDDSETYRGLSRDAVPERERQIDIVVTLVEAAEADGPVLDLCCGEGLMTEALHRRLPAAALLAYDGSQSMLNEVQGRIGGGALSTRVIDLADRGWRAFDPPLRAVVSSLAIHHLDGAQKQALFKDLYDALAPGGVFVLADIVQPASAAGTAIAGKLWDEETERRALALDGNRRGFEIFRETGWNSFAAGAFDAIDKPSTIQEQMNWLSHAGFAKVDLHWMLAGQMILSGWKAP